MLVTYHKVDQQILCANILCRKGQQTKVNTFPSICTVFQRIVDYRVFYFFGLPLYREMMAIYQSFYCSWKHRIEQEPLASGHSSLPNITGVVVLYYKQGMPDACGSYSGGKSRDAGQLTQPLTTIRREELKRIESHSSSLLTTRLQSPLSCYGH